MIRRWLPALAAIPLAGHAASAQDGARPPGGHPPFRPDLRHRVNDPRHLLWRMLKAESTRAFVAREITTREDSTTIEQWVKQDPQRGIRRESIRPAGELIVDNFRRSWLISQRRKQFIERDSRMPWIRERFQSTLRRLDQGGLQIEWQGQDVVAGRTTDIVSVRPPQGVSGPSRRFWVDRETGLRLRTEEREPGGRILSSSYYLSIDLSPTLSDDDFSPPEPPPGFQAIREEKRCFRSLDEARAAGVSPPVPAYLPTGFALRAVEADTEGKRIAARWGNDLTQVSVVRIARAGRRLAQMPAGFVPMPGGARAYLRRDGETCFLVIGSLPDEQLKRIAESIR